jgi:hypothetical protein
MVGRIGSIAAALVGAPLAALAQGAPVPDPADPKAALPAVQYRSAFAGYRPWREQEPGDWSETLRKLGPPLWGPGSQTSVPKPPAKPAPRPGHGGHK